MQTILNKFDWSSIKIIDVFCVNSGAAGTKINDKGQNGFYQIGLKIGGNTEIFYNGEKLNFRDKSILYLPKENRSDIDYNKTIISQGKSICIFFTSALPLPSKPILTQCENAENLFINLNKAYNNPASSFFDYIGIFYNILSLFNKSLFKETIPETSLMPEVIKYMKEHINSNYIDLKTAAQELNISADHFRHKFKMIYGLSPIQYYHKLKTNYIKALICENSYSLSQIAELSGFSDLNYFSRFFKKNTGLTPTEYKKHFSQTVI